MGRQEVRPGDNEIQDAEKAAREKYVAPPLRNRSPATQERENFNMPSYESSNPMA